MVFWLVMIGFLIKKEAFKKPEKVAEYKDNELIIDTTQREWKEIFLKDKKVGYSVSIIKPLDEGYFIQEEILMKLNLMGMGKSLNTITQAQVDKKFLLEGFTFKMSSGIVSFNISGKMERDSLVLTTGKGRGQRTQRINMSRPPMIGAGLGHFFRSLALDVGDSFKLPIFDPSTLSQREMVIRVAGRESLRINRTTYNAFRLEAEMWGQKFNFWVDESGTTLKEEGFMGMSSIKSSAANAPHNIIEDGGDDFYETSAVPIDRKLPKPGRLSSLKLEVEGLEDIYQNYDNLNRGRQTFNENILNISKESPPFNIGYSIPYDGSDELINTYLQPEFNIESDAKEIIDKAGRIIGENKNPLSVAIKLMDWVHNNIEKKPVLSIPSALEVLETGVGDCNEHATLLTALLRASGVPARLSIGLVHSKNKFFYHAWVEAYVGEWITMDATLNQMPVDVGHINLLHGNLDKQVEIIGLIGKLKFKLLEYNYD